MLLAAHAAHVVACRWWAVSSVLSEALKSCLVAIFAPSVATPGPLAKISFTSCFRCDIIGSLLRPYPVRVLIGGG